MKKNWSRWIILSALVCFAALTETRSQDLSTGLQTGTLKAIQVLFPGSEASCQAQMLIDDLNPSGATQTPNPEEESGTECDPATQQTTTPITTSPSSIVPRVPHPLGSVTTVTLDPQPNIFSEALEPANAAATSFQIQDEYPNLLPIPFTPLFAPAAVSNYNPACTPNVSFFMANYANSTVTRIGTCPLANLKVIPMPSNPIQVKLTPDGSTLLVTMYNNAVAFINTATNVATTLPTPLYNPFGIAISPDGTKAYATSFSTAQPVIFQINLATHQLMPQSLQVNTYPKSIFLTPDGSTAWVNFSQSSSIYVIDTLSMTVSGTINAGGTADTGMAFSPDGTKAYISIFGGSVAVFNTATLAQIASITVADQPTDIYLTKDGSRAFVNSYATNGVQSIIDTSSNTVIGTIPQSGPAMGLVIFH